jgi:type VII secretion integral membrane protein EccD
MVTELGAPHLLFGSSCLLVAAFAGYFGTASVARLFTAGIFVGALGIIGSLLALSMSAAGAASIAVTIAIGLLPGYPLLSIRLGKLPIPELPRKAEDLLKDQPIPPRNTVFEAVVRSDEILTGLLTGVAIVSTTAAMWMLADGGVAAVVLTVEAVLGLLLRARLFPTPRQRVPLIAAAIAAIALLAVGFALTAGPAARIVEVVVLVLAAAFVLAGGLLYSRRPPSPYMGRFADILDVLAIIALIPTAGLVTGFYRVVQAMLAGVGG